MDAGANSHQNIDAPKLQKYVNNKNEEKTKKQQ